MSVSHIIQVSGSLVLLGAFLAVLADWLAPRAVPNLALNAAGSAVLAVNAIVEQQPGILLLEGTWALASLLGLARVLLRACRRSRGETTTPPTDTSAGNTATDDIDDRLASGRTTTT